ncbi:modulator of drug activity B [Serratia marcescens]|uniref:Modulator of drug activity B n=1 Tax=Serratia marcescens TaxID=615 RepID=A0AA46K8L2_SERMA|nr:NAD(P)H-dependent oxidoreductase [Serratia marcescens]TQI86494.1 modulator of drug activity B [Serratia marcescens]HEJ7121857.1 NAD(P)H-dependent oxidoreductase [Serratia marcescens]
MKNIFIVNSSTVFGSSKGSLNNYLDDVAVKYFENHSFNVKTTNVRSSYDISEEVEKYLWSDFVIYQLPAWWMEMPWTLKKYIDEVFTAGEDIYTSGDGRSRKDLSKKYGSGGLLVNKKYMLSVTWNAPKEAFLDKNQFFEGNDIDNVFFAFHKAHQFIGMTHLPAFGFFDVIKNPDIDRNVKAYIKHLHDIFKDCHRFSA